MGSCCVCSGNWTASEPTDEMLDELIISPEELHFKSSKLLISGYVRNLIKEEYLDINIDTICNDLLIDIFSMFFGSIYRMGLITKRKQEIYIDVVDYVNIIQGTCDISLDTAVIVKSSIQTNKEKEKISKMKDPSKKLKPSTLSQEKHMQEKFKIFQKMGSEQLLRLIQSHGIDASADPHNLTDQLELAQFAFDLVVPKTLPETLTERKVQKEEPPLCTVSLKIAAKNEIQDIMFHPCVNKDGFLEIKRKSKSVLIPFTPLDEREFILMKFRNMGKHYSSLPFEVDIEEKYDAMNSVWSLNVAMERKTALVLNEDLFNTHVIVSAPPTNKKNRNIVVTTGNVTNEDMNDSINWLIHTMQKNVSGVYKLQMEVNGLREDVHTEWRKSKDTRKCVRIKFIIRMQSMAEMTVRYLKINDTSSDIKKWVRYYTVAGDYAFDF